MKVHKIYRVRQKSINAFYDMIGMNKKEAIEFAEYIFGKYLKMSMKTNIDDNIPKDEILTYSLTEDMIYEEDKKYADYLLYLFNEYFNKYLNLNVLNLVTYIEEDIVILIHSWVLFYKL